MEPANLLIIKSLDDGWCDKDIVMLHACFQLLEDVIENEKLFEMTDWEQTEEFIQARQELQQLYDWWQIRKELTARDDFDVLDRSSYEKDTQQLMKLIELRHFLWT